MLAYLTWAKKVTHSELECMLINSLLAVSKEFVQINLFLLLIQLYLQHMRVSQLVEVMHLLVMR